MGNSMHDYFELGYRTFVSPSDPYRYDKEHGHILDVEDGYHQPKYWDGLPDQDLEHLEFSLNPGKELYLDPDLSQKDYEEYQSLISTVLSRHMCDVNPLMLYGKHGSFNRLSVKMKDLDSRLSSDVKGRAKACNVKLRRSMPKNNRYIFEVKSRGGSGSHTVTVKAQATDKRVKSLEKADLSLACSCQFWIFYGPEYHARRGGYLEGNAQGTATPPRIRDPKGNHVICKHVYAVFDVLKNYQYRW